MLVLVVVVAVVGRGGRGGGRGGGGGGGWRRDGATPNSALPCLCNLNRANSIPGVSPPVAPPPRSDAVGLEVACRHPPGSARCHPPPPPPLSPGSSSRSRAGGRAVGWHGVGDGGAKDMLGAGGRRRRRDGNPWKVIGSLGGPRCPALLRAGCRDPGRAISAEIPRKALGELWASINSVCQPSGNRALKCSCYSPECLEPALGKQGSAGEGCFLLPGSQRERFGGSRRNGGGFWHGDGAWLPMGPAGCCRAVVGLSGCEAAPGCTETPPSPPQRRGCSVLHSAGGCRCHRGGLCSLGDALQNTPERSGWRCGLCPLGCSPCVRTGCCAVWCALRLALPCRGWC